MKLQYSPNKKDINKKVTNLSKTLQKVSNLLDIDEHKINEYAKRMIGILFKNIEELTYKNGKKVPGMINNRALILMPDKYLYNGTSFKWDTEIILNLFSKLYPKLAADIYLTRLFKSQWKDGMVPHVLFNSNGSYYFAPSLWKDIGEEGEKIHYDDGIRSEKGFFTSGITQPAIFGFSKIIRKGIVNKKVRIKFIKALHNYFNWAFDNSSYDHLFVSIHPWELGIDNGGLHQDVFQICEKYWKKNKILQYSSIKRVLEIRQDIKFVPPSQRPTNKSYLLYVALVKYFQTKNWNRKLLVQIAPWRVVSHMMNTFLIKSCIELADMAHNEGLDKIKKDLLANAGKCFRKLQEKMWDEKDRTFYGFMLTDKEEKKLRVNTLDNFFPLLITKSEMRKLGATKDEILTFAKQAKAAIRSHLLNKKEYWKNGKYPYFMTVLPKNSPYFDEIRYWQAPVWPHMNLFMYMILKNWGFEKQADLLRKTTIEMMLRHNSPSEYYNPRTGKRLGSQEGFSWAASTFLDLLITRN